MENINYQLKPEHQTVIIEIHRPQQLNSLNNLLITNLEHALIKAECDDGVRSVIITGSGDKAFVAGADIKELQFFNSKKAHQLSRAGKDKLFNRVENFKKPIISAINGYALGGGLELALSSHIRIASELAKLGLPETTLGIIPGYGGTQRLPKIVGRGNAFEMILTGKIINAKEAYRIGLVNRVVQPSELISQSLNMAKIFKKTSSEALSAAIKVINNCYYEKGCDLESKEFSNLFETDNFKEGVGAFLEKRKANFK